MEFIDKLILPQSSEHIQLLHYLLMLILFLFIPFISIILGGTTLSLYYKRKGITEDNKIYLRFAKDVIELVTINKSIGVIIGIAPLLISVLIYAQLLHAANVSTVAYLVFTFLFLTIGLILVYAYRYSLSFAEIFESINEKNISDKLVSDEIKKFRRGNTRLSSKSGRFGLIFLYLAIWIFVAALTLATFTTEWGKSSAFVSLFSMQVLSRYITFIIASFTLTGAAILFGFFYWEGGKNIVDEEYKVFVKNTAIKVTFVSALCLPFFMLVNIIVLPKYALSGAVFAYAVAALILIFLAYHFLYVMLKESSVKFSGQLFYVLLFSLLALIVKDQLAMGNATRLQSEILSTKFERYLADLKAESGVVVKVSGKDIYDTRCSACHRFDSKLIGPPYNTVLPKYEANKKELISFILNPVKKNPDYPPMPNQGLRPNEAEAIADYLLVTYKK
ncbi:MAG: c-type cytochrome [Ignavibacteriaceae bacterium]